MYEWLVIGGGIHGCTVASFLLKRGKVRVEKLRIIDPYDEPMYKWKKNTEKIGMKYLRSPFVHHIDVDPLSLQRFGQKEKWGREHFYGRYKRPSLELFNEHCNSIIDEVGLLRSWYRGFVNSIKNEQGFWKVMTEDGAAIRAQNIVISISINNALNIPNWAKQLKADLPKQVFHVFEDNLANMTSLQPPIMVIGGGITAAHLTIKLSGMFPGKVILIKRHPFRINEFDSNPGWLGPKYLRYFHKTKDYGDRRVMIQQARNKGSLTRELFYQLKRLEKDHQIQVMDGEVKSANSNRNQIMLNVGERIIKGNSMLLATGFMPSVPGGNWLNQVMEDLELSCANCGYPIVNQSLQWSPHLYVSGPLAELEVGPIARNISGARHAAERIVNSL
ncbi:FAD/NAD(P)-binding protein [Mesobacillus maritimus]|uniref:SidA/IucD/PvdA family monooxygenase n=1 Tax=Mesobacillus maritimus TaxID=1643336 RepID=UPI00203E5622|nr:FAD/NAD(P)-binding protein [Mesobacillus maritimus]MCM3584907.1 FAD/NAD(P)-binding protein [Mesobacillus maritimus]